jgi:hypothetical protein
MKHFGKKRMLLHQWRETWKMEHRDGMAILNEWKRRVINIYITPVTTSKKKKEKKTRGKASLLEDWGLEDGARENRFLWKLKTANSWRDNAKKEEEMHAMFHTVNLNTRGVVRRCDDNIKTNLTEIYMSMRTFQIYIRVESSVLDFLNRTMNLPVL